MQVNESIALRLRWAVLPALAAALLASTGCRDFEEAPELEEAANVQLATVVGDGYLLSVAPWERWLFVRADDDGIERFSVDLEGEVLRIEPLDDGTALLLMREPNQLVRLNPSSGEAETTELPSAYDALVLSEDQAWVAASFSPTSTGNPGDVFFTPNEVTIIDLTGGSEPVSVQLTGSRPLRLEFTPAFTIPGVERDMRMLMVTAARELTLVDWRAEGSADRQRRIFFAAPDSGANLNVAQVLFTGSTPEEEVRTPRFFVRTQTGSDLFVVDLVASEAGSERELQPSINQVALGSRPAQLHRFLASGQEKLLAISSQRAELTIVDVATNRTTAVDLPRTMADTLVWPTLDESGERWEALMFANGFDRLFFVDLERVEAEGTGAISSIAAGAAVQGVSFAGEAVARPTALAAFSNNRGVSVVDLGSRTAVAFQSSATLASRVLLGTTLFVTVEGRGVIAALNIETGQTAQFDTGRTVAALHAAPGSNRLLATHSGRGGRFTLVDVLDLTDEGAIRLDGIVLDGILDAAGGQ